MNDVFPRRLIPAGGIRQGRVPAQGKAIIPSTHDGVTRLELEYAILVCLGIFRGRRRRSETRCGDIAIEVIEVCVAYASRKVEGEARDDMTSGAFVEGLSLVLETREMSLQTG